MTEGLTHLGWLFMVVGWTAIILLNVYCFSHFYKEKQEKIVGPLEVETELDELDR